VRSRCGGAGGTGGGEDGGTDTGITRMHLTISGGTGAAASPRERTEAWPVRGRAGAGIPRVKHVRRALEGKRRRRRSCLRDGAGGQAEREAVSTSPDAYLELVWRGRGLEAHSDRTVGEVAHVLS